MSNRLLKRALFANALFSLVTGATLVLFPRLIVELMGIGFPLLFRLLGFGLIVFATLVGLLSRQPSPNTLYALLISVADLVWVVGSALVIALSYGILTTIGMFVLMGVATVVLLFALAQLRGIERTFRVEGAPEPTHRLCIDVVTTESADAMWRKIADLGHIDQFSPTLASVRLRNDTEPGVGAIRDCRGTNGDTWSERCILFEPEDRQYTVEFLSDEPDFPYPFRTMTGGWRVRAAGQGSVVTIWFETTPKSMWLTPFFLPIMGRGVTANLPEVVANMAAGIRGYPTGAKTLHNQKLPATLVAC